MSLLTRGLNNFGNDGSRVYFKGQELVSMACDRFVYAVSKWRNDQVEYTPEWPVDERKKYSRALSGWLINQYELIKAGKESDIKPRPEYKLE
jgi:hypothetical protein